MEKWKKIGKALLFPCWGITIFLVIISAVMLVYAFGYENPNSVITYASYFISAYAFYCLTMAIKNMIKYRNMEQPILSAAKMLSFAFALMSILAMQTAMLTEFGNGREDFARLVN